MIRSKKHCKKKVTSLEEFHSTFKAALATIVGNIDPVLKKKSLFAPFRFPITASLSSLFLRTLTSVLQSQSYHEMEN